MNTRVIEHQTDAAQMRSTFRIREREEQTETCRRLIPACVPFIFFCFRRFDRRQALIRWPDSSINMTKKIDNAA
ncbi:MAG: hypothetical protein AAGK71_05645 [Pseudomonadota bacterium]